MRPFVSRAGSVGLVLAGALAAIGCQPGPVTIAVQSPADANQGRPLHMVVRTVDEGTFLADSYQDVAAKVTAPDASVVASNVVFPGSTMKVEVARQDKSPLGVYFFFTSPQSSSGWKTLVPLPLPGQVQIQLQGSSIARVSSD